MTITARSRCRKILRSANFRNKNHLMLSKLNLKSKLSLLQSSSGLRGIMAIFNYFISQIFRSVNMQKIHRQWRSLSTVAQYD